MVGDVADDEHPRVSRCDANQEMTWRVAGSLLHAHTGRHETGTVNQLDRTGLDQRHEHHPRITGLLLSPRNHMEAPSTMLNVR